MASGEGGRPLTVVWEPWARAVVEEGLEDVSST